MARSQDKLFRDAIEYALRRKVNGKSDRTRVQVIAEKLVKRASMGDMVAIKEVIDRIDGKPVQALDATDGGSIAIIQWSGDNPSPIKTVEPLETKVIEHDD